MSLCLVFGFSRRIVVVTVFISIIRFWAGVKLRATYRNNYRYIQENNYREEVMSLVVAGLSVG